jgi:hypothetical protein
MCHFPVRYVTNYQRDPEGKSSLRRSDSLAFHLFPTPIAGKTWQFTRPERQGYGALGHIEAPLTTFKPGRSSREG